MITRIVMYNNNIEMKIRMKGIAFNKTLLANCSGVAMFLMRGVAIKPKMRNATLTSIRPNGIIDFIFTRFLQNKNFMRGGYSRLAKTN